MTFSFRLTELEMERLGILAERHGMSRSQYLRGIINGDIFRELSDEEIQKKVGQVLRGMI